MIDVCPLVPFPDRSFRSQKNGRGGISCNAKPGQERVRYKARNNAALPMYDCETDNGSFALRCNTLWMGISRMTPPISVMTRFFWPPKRNRRFIGFVLFRGIELRKRHNRTGALVHPVIRKRRMCALKPMRVHVCTRTAKFKRTGYWARDKGDRFRWQTIPWSRRLDAKFGLIIINYKL